MDTPLVIAQRLARLREVLAETQAEFCRQTGLATNRWNQYESGERPITLAAAAKLRKRYGVTLDFIYFGDQSGLPLRLVQMMNEAA